MKIYFINGDIISSVKTGINEIRSATIEYDSEKNNYRCAFFGDDQKRIIKRVNTISFPGIGFVNSHVSEGWEHFTAENKKYINFYGKK